MKCPSCEGTQVPVRDSRVQNYGGDSVRKRVRQCVDCGYRFLTWECYELQIHDDAEDVIRDASQELVVMSGKIDHILTRLNRKD